MAGQTAPKRRAPKAPASPSERAYESGLKALSARDFAGAIAAFEAALAANPAPERQSAILFALANAARGIGHVRAAEDLYGRVLAQEPDRREALVNLSNLLRSQARYREAQVLLGEALERHRDAAELWLALGHVMREIGDRDNARLFFAEALRLKPSSVAARASIGDLLCDLGDAAGALAAYEGALRKEPDNARIRYNRALLLLAEGRLAAGWRDHALRFAAADPPLVFEHGLPAWRGEALAGGGLLVCAEQGLGDQVIFASCLDEAIRRASPGASIIECEPRLVALFARSFPSAEVRPYTLVEQGGIKRMTYAPGALDGLSHAVALGDLPALLRPRLELCPAPHAYLKPDVTERAHFALWLETLGPGPRIGVSWRSANMGGLRALQFAPRADWGAFLRDLPGVLVCLQYDATAEECAALATEAGRPLAIPPDLDQKNALDRVAGLLSALDAVVTAPTAVSALAAGIGTPTLKILYDRTWTALGGDTEPLAPACHLIRPDRAGHWPQTFERARARLATLLAP